MNEENKINYYAIIPAPVRYDQRLKPAEKLLYGEITALANKYGYCYAQNKYFAELYGVTTGTVSKWFSHLQELDYIIIEIIRNNKKEIISRHIYITAVPYGQKRPYPYRSKKQYPIVKNDINNNININKDDLFNLIINNSNQIATEFYNILEKLELIYPQSILLLMKQDNTEKLKQIIFSLYEIYNSNLQYLLHKIDRESLLKLYNICKMKNPSDLQNYFKKAVINNYF